MNVFEPFKIRNVVKQGCVLVTTLFAILTLLFLKQAFSTAEEGIYLHTQTDGKLFNPSRLKTKVKNNKIRDILFTYFGFTISLKKKTKLLTQSTTSYKITIKNHDLKTSYSF